MKRIFTRGLLMGLAAALASPAVAADAPKAFKVERIADIDYCEIANDPDAERHRLNVFRPVGKNDCPVIFLVHGGGWMIGGKDKYFGIYGYANIAATLARRGVVVVLPNYRLSPKAKHPDHIEDVARRLRLDGQERQASTAAGPTRFSRAAILPAAIWWRCSSPSKFSSGRRACRPRTSRAWCRSAASTTWTPSTSSIRHKGRLGWTCKRRCIHSRRSSATTRKRRSRRRR